MKKISILLVLTINILFAQNTLNKTKEESELGTISSEKYELEINKHGVVLKSANETETIYLGKDCDVYSRELGKGEWGFYPQSTDFKVVFNEGFEFITAQDTKQWYAQIPDSLKKCEIPKIKYSIENYELGTPKEVTTILDKLRNYGGVEEYGYKQWEGMKHGIVGFYNYRYMQKESILVITYSLPVGKFECRACGVSLSFFLFEKKDRGLIYNRSFINAIGYAEWGVIPDYNPFDIIDLGGGVEGLYRETSWATQGYGGGSIQIYILSNTFDNAFDAVSYSDDGGAKEISMESWSSKFFISKDYSSFHNILIKSKGMREGKKFSSEDVYKFNGKTYKLDNSDSIKKNENENDISKFKCYAFSNKIKGKIVPVLRYVAEDIPILSPRVILEGEKLLLSDGKGVIEFDFYKTSNEKYHIYLSNNQRIRQRIMLSHVRGNTYLINMEPALISSQEKGEGYTIDYECTKID